MPMIPPVLRAGTRDLPDVPPLLQYLIGSFLNLAWLSTFRTARHGDYTGRLYFSRIP